jgi:hypothetical protein
MALSVSPGVPLPISAQPNAVDTFWAPACPGVIGTECDVYGGDERYVVTMSADWTPNAGTTNTNPNPPNPNPVVPHPTPSLLAGTAQGVVRSNTVIIPLTCATALCIGQAQLQNFEANNAAVAASKGSARKRKHVTYATGSFRIAPGKTLKIKLKLTQAGRQYFRTHRRATLWLNAALQRGRKLSLRIPVKH